jgi:dUTP pyrophosphatase
MSEKTIVKIELLNKNATIPKKMSEFAAGYDIYACLDEDITVKPMETSLVPTGFALELPVGFEAQIRPRSGLALNHGNTVLNSPGTIDPDYRGEVKVILINLSSICFTLKKGMRIAQMILSRYGDIWFNHVNDLSITQRNKNGFGHTDM